MKALSSLCLVVSLVLLLGGCGDNGADAETGSAETAGGQEAVLVLDGNVDAANVAVRLAAERGYFKDFGREISSGRPIGPNRPITYVLSEAEDLGIIPLPQFLMAREEAKPIVVIGSLVPQSTIAMIWLRKSGIRSVADLKGKTIAIPGAPFQARFLEAVLKRAGLAPEDVEVKRVGYNLLPVLIGGRADAIFGASWNIQGATLEARGLDPVIKRAPALGIPNYDELVFFTSKKVAAKEPDLIRDFMAGVDRGIAALTEDPGAAAKLFKDDEADPEATPKTSEAEVAATLPLLSKTGYVDPVRVENLQRWMREEGMIRRQLPLSELFTEESLRSP